MLTHVGFENFRGFRKLTLDGLQRVNLVVGKNNSGKTSFLEAIAVLLNPTDASRQFAQFRQIETGLRQHFQAGGYSTWVIHDQSRDNMAKLNARWNSRDLKVFLVPASHPADVVMPQAEKPKQGTKPKPQRMGPSIPSCAVTSHHKTPEQLVQSVGNAIRHRDGEELLESVLRVIDPRIKKVRIVPINRGTQVEIDIGLSKLVPISQVGQGPYRLVEILSEIIGADAQLAFIDELENGIHHTCLIDVWKGIAEAAERFGVQVFATTHSEECIEAAHEAFVERSPYDFAIVQLFREAGEIQARVLHRKHIAAAIDGEIDLRA